MLNERNKVESIGAKKIVFKSAETRAAIKARRLFKL